MITLLILALILGVIMICITGVCVFLLDPIIAILAVCGVYKLIKYLTTKK